MTEFTQITLTDDLTPVPIEEVVFDYRLLSADKRAFVLEKTDETQWLLKKTAENIINIGQNLEEVADILPHGMYYPWLNSEFGMSPQTADNFRHVAKQFKDKSLKFRDFAISALYLLAAPNTPSEAIDDAIQRADKGEKITHALAKKIIEAHEAIKEAQRAEAQARADAIVSQQLLLSTENDLTNQIEALKREMEALVKPEVRIEETEVLPPEVIAQLTQLDELQAKIDALTIDRDKEKERAEGFAQRMLEDRAEQRGKEEQKRARERWHTLSIGFQTAVRNAFAQWPTPLDMQAFEDEDWNEVDHMISAAHQLIEECKKLRQSPMSVIVEAEESFAYVMETQSIP